MFAETPIDSLKIYHRLRAAKVEENAATEIASIFSDVIENNLTTKQDLKNTEIILRKDTKELETNLKHDMKEMEMCLRHDIKEMETGLRHDMMEIETRLKHDMKDMESGLRHDMMEIETRLKHDMKKMESGLELKIEQSKYETIKWMIGWTSGLFLAQTGILISAIKFFK